MNVEPQVQSKLLDLAGVDAELSRIAYRRTALPEQQEVERLEAERLTRKDAAVAVEIILDDLDRDIRKLEGEVDAVRKREDRDRALLQSGSVGSKQLTELEHELGSLVRRQGLLEDELLEVMERREASQSDHDHAGAQLSQIEDELIDARRRRDDAVADLDSAEQRCTADRATLAEYLPADLIAIYEKQRKQNSVGAALLQARRCGACRIELDRGEISRITATAPEVVVRCPECGAILVRTKESGL
ncbi:MULTISPECIES: zinc ribbon domain-containing protein [Rhodococcus]|uniref:C4-type zinc ribbon domain-containing protein n=1 Tax=Rhodococcus oxybenzonivorans TaxID=1990687 RepID=A0AAE5A501_9NOCA|nr:MULTISPECIES: C4-type zinc ribbon domain-containing protein [Rhodococcus]MDV7244260.1 C4-type zinc ribbon domain-containing protein [Rhodococcus oxybenzonivorans]MDV7262959.1 C4-type zinc ribbon domain-containing protein [Rhodococcus oxybenzonivorans]MDV7274498.1 C4-type zinc ribbon domain-containing protein [Rhodococcus oxybenzonivorans]MDV7335811.1 C4-type zinc ribbon domain-containing protein [Rhodococcus oxybenzonivorans]MDV7345448.1 C4-type zinc ribbon domain-containing protein [Rhodoc